MSFSSGQWVRIKNITDIAPPPPPRPFASVRFDPLAWSSGSDQRRISGCGIRWLLAGPDSLPLWLCRVCAFVLLRCFSCSHTVLPKEHSLGIIFFSSLSSCKCCIFLQFYLHFTTDYTCMIVYVTNNKEPWTLKRMTEVSKRPKKENALLSSDPSFHIMTSALETIMQ